MEAVDRSDQFLFSQMVVPGSVNMAAQRPAGRVKAMLRARAHGDHPSVVSSVHHDGAEGNDTETDTDDEARDAFRNAGDGFDDDSDTDGDGDGGGGGGDGNGKNRNSNGKHQQGSERSQVHVPSHTHAHDAFNAQHEHPRLPMLQEEKDNDGEMDDMSMSGSGAPLDQNDFDDDESTTFNNRGRRPEAGSGWDIASRFRSSNGRPAAPPVHFQPRPSKPIERQPQPQPQPQLGRAEPDAASVSDSQFVMSQRYGGTAMTAADDCSFSSTASSIMVANGGTGTARHVQNTAGPVATVPKPASATAPVSDVPPVPTLASVPILPLRTETPLQQTIRECMQPPPPSPPLKALPVTPYTVPPSGGRPQKHGSRSKRSQYTDFSATQFTHSTGSGSGSGSNTGSDTDIDNAAASAVESSVSHPRVREKGRGSRRASATSWTSHTSYNRRKSSRHSRDRSRSKQPQSQSQPHLHSRPHRSRHRSRHRHGHSDRRRRSRADSDFEAIELANKRELIAELDKLALGGTLLAFKPTMDHSVAELRHELERRLANTTLVQRVACIKGLVKVIALVLELVLSTFMRVKNWSVYITENLDTGAYDQSLEQIYRSIWKRGAPSPWVNLGFLIVGSLLGFHFLGMQPSTVVPSTSTAPASSTASAGKSLSAGLGGMVGSLMSGGGVGGMLAGMMTGVTGANMPQRAGFPDTGAGGGNGGNGGNAVKLARPPSPPPKKPTLGDGVGDQPRRRGRISAPVP